MRNPRLEEKNITQDKINLFRLRKKNKITLQLKTYEIFLN